LTPCVRRTSQRDVGSSPVRPPGDTVWPVLIADVATRTAVAGVRPEQLASVDVHGPLDAGTRPGLVFAWLAQLGLRF
jgi:hypothetical protein